MGQSTENYEGNELKEDQFKGDIGATHKVKELKGNGKICNGNEKITHFLANQNVVDAPNPFLITVAVWIFHFDGKDREHHNQQQEKHKKQSSFHGDKIIRATIFLFLNHTPITYSDNWHHNWHTHYNRSKLSLISQNPNNLESEIEKTKNKSWLGVLLVNDTNW